ncbi:hypothetical protein HR060_14645 [Catenovulum sp. SM1970]|uniref:hypothetical protein n=1 Tax=Marinifaba aquimaris TaxID=2741323 RepID=UPI001573B863|nr:hypothetical protein [Marinifaba aquimaris]NTS78095.1 hypothetical protein [Marinifaba aquimaris]
MNTIAQYCTLITLTCLSFASISAPPNPSPWQKAKLQGASYRAIGQEPAWQLEVYHKQKLILVTNYGEKRTVFTQLEIISSPEKKQTRISALNPYPITVQIKGEKCVDTMSGQEYSSTTKVISHSNTFKGCGKALH